MARGTADPGAVATVVVILGPALAVLAVLVLVVLLLLTVIVLIVLVAIGLVLVALIVDIAAALRAVSIRWLRRTIVGGQTDAVDIVGTVRRGLQARLLRQEPIDTYARAQPVCRGHERAPLFASQCFGCAGTDR